MAQGRLSKTQAFSGASPSLFFLVSNGTLPHYAGLSISGISSSDACERVIMYTDSMPGTHRPGAHDGVCHIA